MIGQTHFCPFVLLSLYRPPMGLRSWIGVLPHGHKDISIFFGFIICVLSMFLLVFLRNTFVPKTSGQKVSKGAFVPCVSICLILFQNVRNCNDELGDVG